MRRDQRPVQVEPDALPDALPVMVDALQDKIHTEIGETRPAVAHRQARENQQLASMRLEREALARRLETMAPDDHARITYPDVIKRYDAQIERFEQALKEGQ